MDRLANIAAFVEPAPFPSPFSAIPMACGAIPESFAAPNAEVMGRASPYRPFGKTIARSGRLDKKLSIFLFRRPWRAWRMSMCVAAPHCFQGNLREPAP
jgi:hypothetical protein